MNKKFYFILGFGLGLIFTSLVFIIYYNLTLDNFDTTTPQTYQQQNYIDTKQD